MKDPQLNPNQSPEVCRIKRHPIGILMIYASVGVGFVLAIVILLVALPGLNLHLNGSQSMLLWGGLVFAALCAALCMLIASKVYWASELCVTEDGVSQIVQHGLFNRSIARLDMDKIEDVTAQQKGIMPSMFNYGTLMVETAGEADNFIFPYCPNPNDAAQKIHIARQHWEERMVRNRADVQAERLQNYAQGPAQNNQPPMQPPVPQPTTPEQSQPSRWQQPPSPPQPQA